MKTFNIFVSEKSNINDKKKYDRLIKELESLNDKDNNIIDKNVKEIIAFLKQARDLKESFADTISNDMISEFIKENKVKEELWHF